MIFSRIPGILAICLCITAECAAQNPVFNSFEVLPGAGCSIFIQWTANEKSDTLDFMVERSPDGQTWQPAKVTIHKLSHRYTCFDNDPVHGYNYYRVRQAGSRNSVSSSATGWVKLNKNDEIFIWPNPARDVFYIKTPFLKGLIDIVSPDGKLVLSVAITNFVTSITTTPLAKGIYFVHIKSGNQEITEKLVKE